GLATVPRRSLVENVGFGPNATHTRSDPTRRYRAEEMRQIVHPTAIVRDRGRDAATFREQFATGTFKQRVHNRIWLTRWVLSPHSWRH
ncbi:MAG TPA: hypothetical protein VK461_05555, partial [Acidimicrobiales bacterium]|nr:hypothetical protein [Acidimicrobiales bacterium]